MAVKVFGFPHLSTEEKHNIESSESSLKKDDNINLNTYSSQLPISDNNVIYEKPYTFSIKKDDKEIFFSVNQLTLEKYQELLSIIFFFNSILELNTIDKSLDLSLLLANFVKCKSEDLLYPQEFLLLKGSMKLNKHTYEYLLNELMKIDNSSLISNYITSNKITKFFLFRKVRKYISRFNLKKLIQRLEMYYIAEELKQLTITEVLNLVHCIVQYNNVEVKKKLQSIMEMINGKQSPTVESLTSMILSAENSAFQMDLKKEYLEIK